MRKQLQQRSEQSHQTLQSIRLNNGYRENDLVLLEADGVHDLLRNVLRRVLREEKVLESVAQVPTVEAQRHTYCPEYEPENMPVLTNWGLIVETRIWSLLLALKSRRMQSLIARTAAFDAL